MSSAIDLLNKTALLGIKITASSGKLQVVAPKGVVTPKLKEELTANKCQILAFLSPDKKTNSPAVYDLVVDGKSFTVIDPQSESLEVFSKSVKNRFGGGRVESIVRR